MIYQEIVGAIVLSLAVGAVSVFLTPIIGMCISAYGVYLRDEPAHTIRNELVYMYYVNYCGFTYNRESYYNYNKIIDLGSRHRSVDANAFEGTWAIAAYLSVGTFLLFLSLLSYMILPAIAYGVYVVIKKQKAKYVAGQALDNIDE